MENYVDHLQARILDLENYVYRLERDSPDVHDEVNRSFSRFKNEERLRLKTEMELRNIRTEFELLKV